MNTKRNDKNPIKTYCYGKLHEFPSIKKAMDFYFEGMGACEGAERDRYLDIYSKLACNEEPFCDCDGVPAPKKQVKPLTATEIAHAKQIVVDKKATDAELDYLRAELSALQEAFNMENGYLIERIHTLSNRRNDYALELIGLEKRGFKA